MPWGIKQSMESVRSMCNMNNSTALVTIQAKKVNSNRGLDFMGKYAKSLNIKRLNV